MRFKPRSYCAKEPARRLWNLYAVYQQTTQRRAPGAVGSSTNVISVLLMGLVAKQYPPYRVRMFNQVYDRTGCDKPARNADEADVYEHALGFLDRFIVARPWLAELSLATTGLGRHTVEE